MQLDNQQEQWQTEQSDRVLARVAGQDHAAFTLLYQRYIKRVYAYLYSRVGNVQDAEDLTTITFMAALAQIQQYRGEGSFAAWLLGIAYHKSIDLHRKTRASAPLAVASEFPDPTPSPDEMVLQQVQREELARALHSLTPERAEAIALRFFGELSNAEVATVMGKGEAAVKMLVHRGLQELRIRLGVREERVR
ncbi:MAG: RNA polymerase sigma factor [Caldilineaceae bacterium]